MAQMRIESGITSISWIPSEAIQSAVVAMPFDVGIGRYDPPPPEAIGDFDELKRSETFRFANLLNAYAEIEDGRVTSAGYLGEAHLSVTRMRLGSRELVFEPTEFPAIRKDPEIGDGWVRFVQTAGGRPGVPAPRRVSRPPYVQIAGPTVWTTLSLTIHADGRSEGELTGASSFPRHWIYDSSGKLVQKSGLIDFKTWYRNAFGQKTPWGDEDSPAFVTAVESSLERELSRSIMSAGAKPEIGKLKEGQVLVEQGAPGRDMFLLLDGALAVEVDGEVLAELGPGVIVGERAALEEGRRTSTLRAVTPCRIATFNASQVTPETMERLAEGHRREES
jgi:Cyclic nucleotide-binding domain